MGIGGKLRLEEGTGNGTHVGFKAPDTEIASEVIWTLPGADGSSGDVLSTNGSGQLSWISSNVSAETTARQLADATLQLNLDAEITARQLADATLQLNLDAEITARQLADSTLQSNINAEITARQLADSTLQSSIMQTSSIDHTFSSTLVSGTHYLLDMRSASANLTLNWPAGSSKADIKISVKPSSSYKVILDFNGTEKGFYAGAEDTTVEIPAGLETTVEGLWDSTDSHWVISDSTMPINGTFSGSLKLTGSLTLPNGGGSDTAISVYEEGSFSAGGDFTGTIYFKRINNWVTLYFNSLTHASNSNPLSAAGVIPSRLRPTANAVNIYGASTFGVARFFVYTSGQFETFYLDWAGSGVARTDAYSAGSITYRIV